MLAGVMDGIPVGVLQGRPSHSFALQNILKLFLYGAFRVLAVWLNGCGFLGRSRITSDHLAFLASQDGTADIRPNLQSDEKHPYLSLFCMNTPPFQFKFPRIWEILTILEFFLSTSFSPAVC